jgi:hypothetical protein
MVDHPLAAMIATSPASVALAGPAAARLSAYLIACGLPATTAATRAAELLARSRAAGGEPDAALPAAFDQLDQWSAALAERPGGDVPRRHRARMLLAQAAARWPEDFVAGSAPEDLRRAVAAVTLEATPDFRPSVMSPQPLDLGPLSEVANETWRTFDKWPVLRVLAVWTLFLLLLGVVFYVVRF